MMAQEAGRPEATTRSRWSTALVAAFGGPFGGFLWIGAGRLALLSLAAFNAIIVVLSYIGFPQLPGVDLTGLIKFSNLGLMVVSAAMVVPLAGRFKPTRWYSHGVWVLILVLISSPMAAFAIRSFLFQPFSIPSGAMKPTLQEGDYLFVSKFAYGYSRYSVPFNLLPIQKRLWGAEPQRGDVVVFKFPPDPSVDYVMRVVGLPGEKIQIIDGVLHINGTAVELVDAGTFTSEDSSKPAKLLRETLPGGTTHFVLSLTDNAVGDNTPEWSVPADHYFVMGDNRDNSSDSRFTVGFVPYENLVGKAVRLFWNSKGTEYRSRQNLDAASAR